MKRYSKTHEINGIKLALMYASYASPELIEGYDSFKETLSLADFPKNQIGKDHPFGFSLGVNMYKITPRTPTGSCMAYSWFYAKRQKRGDNEEYVLIKCKYFSEKADDSPITIAYGMNTTIDSLDNLLNSFTQKTGFKEVDFSNGYLRKLNKSNFPWDILLSELVGYSK